MRRDDVDAFGNPLTRIELTRPHRRLAVVSEMSVQVHPRPPLRPQDSRPWEQVAQLQLGSEIDQQVELLLVHYIVFHLERNLRSTAFIDRLRQMRR